MLVTFAKPFWAGRGSSFAFAAPARMELAAARLPAPAAVEVAGAMSGSAATYHQLHDEEEGTAPPGERAPLLDHDPVERARKEGREEGREEAHKEARRVTRTTTAPTLCSLGFVLGGLSVYTYCRLSDGTADPPAPATGGLADERSSLLLATIQADDNATPLAPTASVHRRAFPRAKSATASPSSAGAHPPTTSVERERASACASKSSSAPRRNRSSSTSSSRVNDARTRARSDEA